MGRVLTAKEAEIDANFERFLELLPDLMADHAGQYALLRDRQVQDFFESALDAQIAGNQRFPDGLFSVQEVSDAVEELGYCAYALDPG